MDRFGKDFWLGFGLLAFSIFCLFYLIPSQVGKLTSEAALLPVLVVGSLGGLATLLMVSNSTRLEDSVESSGREDGGDKRDSFGTHLGIVGVMVAYAWLLDWAGFLLTSLIALIALLLIFGLRQLTVVVGLPIAVVGVIYIGFEIFLGAPLPDGQLLSSVF